MSKNNLKTFYGIGIGPGDPELISLKGYRLINEADTVFVPKANIKGESLAREIVEKIVDKKKSFIEIEFPMTNNQLDLDNRYRESAAIIKNKIDQGFSCVYLTIGDPLLYSTYIYLIRALKVEAPEINIETIPGISAYNALSAKFNFALCEKEERVCITPPPPNIEELRKIIETNDTIVIMKTAKRIYEVISLLKDMNLTDKLIFGSHIGQTREKLINGMNEELVFSAEEAYMSTVIVRKNHK